MTQHTLFDPRQRKPKVVRDKSEQMDYTLALNKELKYGKSFLDFHVPNLPAIFVNSAKSSFTIARKMHKNSIKIYQGIKGKVTLSEDQTINVYDYLENIQLAIIMSCTAIECIVNSILPINYIFKDKKGREYNYYEIQRYIPLEQKLKEIVGVSLSIPQLAKEPFWSKIKHLIRLRNDLIHMKSNETNTVVDQRLYFNQKDDDIISRLIQDETLGHVQSGFNKILIHGDI